MRPTAFRLLNGATLDVVPAQLMRARSIETQRRLAASEWLLRRKSDGRFLALCGGHGAGERWRWLVPGSAGACQEEADALVRRARLPANAERSRRAASRGRVDSALDRELGPDYAARTGLAPFAEPDVLSFGGYDRFRRPLWLDPRAAIAWRRMRAAAQCDDVALDAISGFRSIAYQVGIFRRKRARGQSLEQILAVNAAPGYSEHHSGRALDIGTPGNPPAEESFEATTAFPWLARHASRFGFAMSYPRGNPHGITYEPWHWMWHPCPIAD